MAIQPHDWQDLTPRDLLRFSRRWTLRSWLFVVGVVAAIVSVSWSTGYAYRAGSLPSWVYFLENSNDSPLSERNWHDAQQQFALHYDQLMSWQKLRAIAAGIAKDAPDGLKDEFEIVASLLAQVRGTRGEAHFLAGDVDYVVRVKPADGEIAFEWDKSSSIVKQIALDAGYELSEDEIRKANSNLNWFQFTYLDDAMRHAMIYRGLDGGLNLTIQKP